VALRVRVAAAGADAIGASASVKTAPAANREIADPDSEASDPCMPGGRTGSDG
jgi:hypothetical protein